MTLRRGYFYFQSNYYWQWHWDGATFITNQTVTDSDIETGLILLPIKLLLTDIETGLILLPIKLLLTVTLRPAQFYVSRRVLSFMFIVYINIWFLFVISPISDCRNVIL
jgi:hypothetical protein